MKKAGLYIHIPFCRKKCDYCDFYSEVSGKNIIENFLDSALKEIQFYKNHPVYGTTSFHTLFFGGGTPSLLSPEKIEYFIRAVRKIFHFVNKPEITLEANPESLTLDKLKEFKSTGINRVSIGIQSFQNNELKTLGRLHDVRQAKNAVHWARLAGFENVSLDLIFGVPGQTLPTWQSNIKQAIELDIDHISAYCLTYEPDTVFSRKLSEGILKKTPDELERSMYLSTIEQLDHAGFAQYEISNFAKPGYQCKHNKIYWDFSPYLGIGPSAHSYYTNFRFWNVGNLDSYLNLLKKNELAIAEKEKLSKEQQELEFIFLSLRTTKGLNLHEFEIQFKKSFLNRYSKELDKISSYPNFALYKMEDGVIKLTSQGFILYDEICGYFV